MASIEERFQSEESYSICPTTDPSGASNSSKKMSTLEPPVWMGSTLLVVTPASCIPDSSAASCNANITCKAADAVKQLRTTAEKGVPLRTQRCQSAVQLSSQACCDSSSTHVSATCMLYLPMVTQAGMNCMQPNDSDTYDRYCAKSQVHTSNRSTALVLSQKCMCKPGKEGR